MKLRASHILVPTLSEATFIKDALSKGAAFAELAKIHSKCPSGKNGGALGEFDHGVMVPIFEHATIATPVGSVSEPIQTQFGFHLILRTQ